MIFNQKNFALRDLNTFGIDTYAENFARFDSAQSLVAAVRQLKASNSEFMILGGGSNTIFTGKFKGTILQLATCSIEMLGNDTIVADAGVRWDDVVAWSVENGLQGIENLSAIPGLVGASVVQNIGAYGIEVGDLVSWVEYYDANLDTICLIEGKHCRFGYRQSIFKNALKHCVVLRVAYRLNNNPIAEDYKLNYGELQAQVEALGGVNPDNVRRAVVAIRNEKLPDPAVLGNAGSFFKNPVIDAKHFARLQGLYPDIPHYIVADGMKIPAGWLIDHAGWKGYRTGNVGVHNKQALVIVNHGGAKAKEILKLASKIERNIKKKYGITLEKEVTVV